MEGLMGSPRFTGVISSLEAEFITTVIGGFWAHFVWKVTYFSIGKKSSIHGECSIAVLVLGGI